MEKILVCDGIKDLKEFLEKHKNMFIFSRKDQRGLGYFY